MKLFPLISLLVSANLLSAATTNTYRPLVISDLNTNHFDTNFPISIVGGAISNAQPASTSLSNITDNVTVDVAGSITTPGSVTADNFVDVIGDLRTGTGGLDEKMPASTDIASITDSASVEWTLRKKLHELLLARPIYYMSTNHTGSNFSFEYTNTPPEIVF